MASNVMVWSSKFGGYTSGLWPDRVKILGNPKLFTLFLRSFWNKLEQGLIHDHLFPYSYHLKNVVTLSSL